MENFRIYDDLFYKTIIEDLGRVKAGYIVTMNEDLAEKYRALSFSNLGNDKVRKYYELTKSMMVDAAHIKVKNNNGKPMLGDLRFKLGQILIEKRMYQQNPGKETYSSILGLYRIDLLKSYKHQGTNYDVRLASIQTTDLEVGSKYRDSQLISSLDFSENLTLAFSGTKETETAIAKAEAEVRELKLLVKKQLEDNAPIANQQLQMENAEHLVRVKNILNFGTGIASTPIGNLKKLPTKR